MSRAKAWFLGGGPGAPDLLTVRAARALSEADIVIYGAELIMREAITENAAADAELLPWPPATMADLLDAYSRASSEDLVVARLLWGDPAVYADLSQELERVRELGMPFEIVPGVGALSAAVEALGKEVITARTDQSLLITSPKAPLEALAGPGQVLAIYGARKDAEHLQERLLAAGHPADTSCVVLGSLSWPGEVVVRCPLQELSGTLEDGRFDRRTLVLVAPIPGAPIPGGS
jgi:precorrin-4/cobalt-precorrin-4 C11-methyltransferase